MRCVRLSSFEMGWVDETVSTRGQDSGSGEIDLHGLYVKEAIDYTDRAIEAAKHRGDTTLNIIVGIGCGRLRTGMCISAFGGVPRLRKVHFRLTMANVVHAAAESPARARGAGPGCGRRVGRGVPGTLTPKIREARVFLLSLF